MYDNIQLFSNNLVFYDNMTEDILTGHNITTMFSKEAIFNIPMVAVFALQIFLIITRSFWFKVSIRYFITKEIYEGLKIPLHHDFFECLT
jgi:hypothetical protein